MRRYAINKIQELAAHRDTEREKERGAGGRRRAKETGSTLHVDETCSPGINFARDFAMFLCKSMIYHYREINRASDYLTERKIHFERNRAIFVARPSATWTFDFEMPILQSDCD